MKPNKGLLLIGGASGMGKSELATRISLIADSGLPCERVRIEADHYRMVGGVYRHDLVSNQEAHCSCRTRTLQELADDRDKLVIVSNTFTSRAELQEYIAMGRLAGVRVDVILLIPTFASVIERAAGRNVHNVPPDVVWQQSRKLYHNYLAESHRNSVSQDHYLLDVLKVDSVVTYGTSLDLAAAIRLSNRFVSTYVTGRIDDEPATESTSVDETGSDPVSELEGEVPAS